MHSTLTQAQIWLRAAEMAAEVGGADDDKAAEQLAFAQQLLRASDPTNAQYAALCARAAALTAKIAHPNLSR